MRLVLGALTSSQKLSFSAPPGNTQHDPGESNCTAQPSRRPSTCYLYWSEEHMVSAFDEEKEVRQWCIFTRWTCLKFISFTLSVKVRLSNRVNRQRSVDLMNGPQHLMVTLIGADAKNVPRWLFIDVWGYGFDFFYGSLKDFFFEEIIGWTMYSFSEINGSI